MSGGGLITVEQCKRIIAGYLSHCGRGGFTTGIVRSVSPLIIRVEDRYDVGIGNLYVTENCIGLIMHYRHEHEHDPQRLRNDVIVRRPLQIGEGVLLLCRPDHLDNSRYILLDRIQPYRVQREVDVRDGGNDH